MNTFFKQIFLQSVLLSLFTGFSGNAMEPETYQPSLSDVANAMPDEHAKKKATDLQIYQLLSAAAAHDSCQNENPQWYLPKDIIQVIATTAYSITEKHCYDEHGKCVEDVDSLLPFLRKRAYARVDIDSTVNVVKMCLNYSAKSLCTLRINNKNSINDTNTILHQIVIAMSSMPLTAIDVNPYCFDVVCQTAGKNLMDFLCTQNSVGWTALHYAARYGYNDAVEKIIFIAGNRTSELVSIKDGDNRTALMLAKALQMNIVNRRRNKYNATECEIRLDNLRSIIELLSKYENING